MKEQFINRYQISKTLRFRLIPEGNTQRNFDEQVFAADERLARNYPAAKEIIDRVHKKYIEERLADFRLTKLGEYAELYGKDNTQEQTDKAAESMRKEISERFTKDDFYNKVLFKTELFSDKDAALSVVRNEEEREIIRSYGKSTTYFIGFNQNRGNLYTCEGKPCEIAYRIVDQNLPRFLDNAKVGRKVLETLPEDSLDTLERDIRTAFGINPRDIFDTEFFNRTLNQAGIDRYNTVIGGYRDSESIKVKGFNEYINLYNQSGKGKLPLLVPLYKQILSDRESASFIPLAFSSDEELLSVLSRYRTEADSEYGKSIIDAADELGRLFGNIRTFDFGGIYVANGPAVNEISNAVCGSWSIIRNAISAEYDSANPKKGKDSDAYDKKRSEALKKIRSYSLKSLQGYIDLGTGDGRSLAEYIKVHSEELCRLIAEKSREAEPLFAEDMKRERKLVADENAAELIKAFLDSLMDLLHFAKMFLGSGKEPDKDEAFYGAFSPLYMQLSGVTELYDRVRNYLTQKPYSTKKMRLIFGRGDFLSGWAQPGEWNKQEAHLFEKGGNYYLFITSDTAKASGKKNKNGEAKISEAERQLFSKENYEPAYHIEYLYQKPDSKNLPRVFIHSKGDKEAPSVKELNLPIDDIAELYSSGWYKAEHRKKDPVLYRESLTKLIDYYKTGLSRHESYREFEFDWKESSEYKDINDFCRDSMQFCYIIRKKEINWSGLIRLVDERKGYLFRIYSKDFSEHSKGTPNLHTLYFRMLFDEANLNSGCFRLLGGAEMFYRRASLKLSETTVHPKGKPVGNKNPLNGKPESVFDYDLIKDRRFTEDQFYLHFPIAMNCRSEDSANLSLDVRKALKAEGGCHIIGIDRGERNLLYVCVIDEKGRIVEQMSLNEIVGDNGYRVDYHELLDRREKERDEARKSWKNIENIKELKEGYMSQVIHRICELIVRYDAVVAMEDLNSGFKNSRVHVEKQVYQKFENMLTEKLRFLAGKKADPMSDGGLLRAYQLTNGQDGAGRYGQDGIIFYIPAWNTSKIDPVTGFVDMLKPKYESVEKSREFVRRIDDIRFNPREGYYEFDVDMSKFPKGAAFCRKQWTVCTNGRRIESFRENGQWRQREVILTEEFDRLFDRFGIDRDKPMKEQILRLDEKAFFAPFMHLLALALQMRNSLTGRTDVDYLISPVKGGNGRFYSSNDYAGQENAPLPRDADANGAYNIARKVLLFIRKLKQTDDDAAVRKLSTRITNAEWLEFTQKSHE